MRGLDNLYADKWYGLTIYTLTNDMIRQSIHGYNGMIRPSIHEYNGMGWQSIHGQIKLENPYTNISTRLGVRALYHTFSDLNLETLKWSHPWGFIKLWKDRINRSILVESDKAPLLPSYHRKLGEITLKDPSGRWRKGVLQT